MATGTGQGDAPTAPDAVPPPAVPEDTTDGAPDASAGDGQPARYSARAERQPSSTRRTRTEHDAVTAVAAEVKAFTSQHRDLLSLGGFTGDVHVFKHWHAAESLCGKGDVAGARRALASARRRATILAAHPERKKMSRRARDMAAAAANAQNAAATT